MDHLQRKLLPQQAEIRGQIVRKLPAIWNIPTGDGNLFGTATLDVTVVPESLTPALAGALIGIAPSASWIAPVTLLAASPEAGIHVQSHGKAQVRDPEIDGAWLP